MRRMKRRSLLHLTLLLLIFFIVACAGPQHTAGTTDTSAPPGVSVITVAVEDTPQQAYRRAASLLQQEGFALSSSDGDLRSLTTEPAVNTDVFAPVRGFQVSVLVSEAPTRITLTAQTEGGQVRKRGQSGSPARKAWKALHLLAERMNGRLSYE